jgi:hypothetical protein
VLTERINPLIDVSVAQIADVSVVEVTRADELLL